METAPCSWLFDIFERPVNFSQHFSIAMVDVPIGYGADVAQASETAEKAARAAVADAPLVGMLLGEVAVLGVQSVTTEGMTLRV